MRAAVVVAAALLAAAGAAAAGDSSAPAKDPAAGAGPASGMDPAGAAAATAAEKEPAAARAPAAPANYSATAADQLKRLKALVGTWTGKGTHGAGGPSDVKVEWRLTGGGNAVTETLFAGTPHEMMTVYHLDGPDLLATHYCSLGNAPTLRAVPSEPGTIQLEFVRGANMKPSDAHMHAAKITFVDADHLRSEWTSWKHGKASDVARFELERAK